LIVSQHVVHIKCLHILKKLISNNKLTISHLVQHSEDVTLVSLRPFPHLCLSVKRTFLITHLMCPKVEFYLSGYIQARNMTHTFRSI